MMWERWEVMDMMWGWSWAGMIWMVVFWVALIAFGVWAVRQFSSRSATGSSAGDILAERFAKGEIDAEEFASRRRELSRR